MPTQTTSFRAFLAALSLDWFASNALTALLSFQVYAVRHHTLDIGWLGLAEALPGITLVLHGGHIADRTSRRNIAVVTFVLLTALAAGIAALCLPGLTPPGAHILAPLITAAFLAGVIRAYANPAAAGLEAQVVSAASTLRSIGHISTAAQLAEVAGPIAAGFAWSALGAAASYAAIAACFGLAAIAVLTGIDSAPPPPSNAAPAWRQIAEGARYVFTDQILVGSMALDLFAVFFGGATALLPVFATAILHVGAIGFGFLRSAMGVGSLLAVIFAPRLLPQRHAGIVLHAAIILFGVATIAFGLSRSLALSLTALLLAGVADGISVIIRRAILRLASPDAMRGRISAVKSIFIGSSNELGAFESGVAATLIGPAAAVWAGGVLTLAIVAATAATLPKLLRLNLAALATGPAIAPEDTMPERPAA